MAGMKAVDTRVYKRDVNREATIIPWCMGINRRHVIKMIALPPLELNIPTVFNFLFVLVKYPALLHLGHNTSVGIQLQKAYSLSFDFRNTSESVGLGEAQRMYHLHLLN
jgi:hypothetical protein